MHAIQQKPLAFWKTVLTSFLLWPSALKQVLPLAIVMSLLSYISEHILAYKSESGGLHLMIYVTWIAFEALVAIIFYTATLCRINSIFHGSKISLRDACIRGMRKFWDQCVINLLLFGMVIFILWLCVTIFIFALHYEWKIVTVFVGGVIILIMLSFLYFVVRFAFTGVAMALKDFEKPSSLKYRIKTCFYESYTLVRGYWWRTFGAFMIAAISTIVPILLLEKFTEAFGTGPLTAILFFITQIAVFPLFSIFALVLFYDLQTRQLRFSQKY